MSLVNLLFARLNMATSVNLFSNCWYYFSVLLIILSLLKIHSNQSFVFEIECIILHCDIRFLENEEGERERKRNMSTFVSPKVKFIAI